MSFRSWAGYRLRFTGRFYIAERQEAGVKVGCIRSSKLRGNVIFFGAHTALTVVCQFFGASYGVFGCDFACGSEGGLSTKQRKRHLLIGMFSNSSKQLECRSQAEAHVLHPSSRPAAHNVLGIVSPSDLGFTTIIEFLLLLQHAESQHPCFKTHAKCFLGGILALSSQHNTNQASEMCTSLRLKRKGGPPVRLCARISTNFLAICQQALLLASPRTPTVKR